MSLNSLRVLHIKSFNNQQNEVNPLAEFKMAVNPFSPMTCSRHVYIMSGTPDFDIQTLANYLKDHSDHLEWLDGHKAYEFLLRWSVGAESHKYHGNDQFVLGSIRDAWTYYVASNEKVDLTLIKIMQMLFEDARQIRDTIQHLEVLTDAFKELLLRMCHNCTQSREAQQKPAYELMLEQNQSYITSAQSAFISKKSFGLSKSMHALNAKMEVESIKPSLIDEATPQIRMFRTNLSYALEKRALAAKSFNPQSVQDPPSNASTLLRKVQ